MKQAEKKLQQLQKQCDDFNAKHKPGDLMTVRKDIGEPVTGSLRYQAQVLSGHSAVAWVTGVSGCYDLDRIAPAAERQAASE